VKNGNSECELSRLDSQGVDLSILTSDRRRSTRRQMSMTSKVSVVPENLRGVPQANPEDALARARKLMAEAVGIDSHIDTIQRVLVMGEDLGQQHDLGHVDFPRLREGGMNAPFFAFWVPVLFRGAEAVRRTLDLRDAMQSVLDTHRNQIELATTAEDIRRIVKAGKISAFLTIEGGHTIDDDLRVLRMYYRLGMRSMTLTHARNTDWADSASDTPACRSEAVSHGLLLSLIREGCTARG
jgi:hypothetical protein